MLHEVLIIHDDGQNLKIEDMQYLGQRFWRKSAQQNGHGLGLSLVKTVLNKYGYQIQFTAAQPQGLSIHISLAASGSLTYEKTGLNLKLEYQPMSYQQNHAANTVLNRQSYLQRSRDLLSYRHD